MRGGGRAIHPVSALLYAKACGAINRKMKKEERIQTGEEKSRTKSRKSAI